LNTIISLTHNDFDALACSLCIKEKFSSFGEIATYSTNYRNLQTLCHDIEDRIRANRENIKMLCITDISFQNHKQELLSLKWTAEEFKIPVLFVDHHLYEEGFFDDLKSPKFSVFWDDKFCAGMNTFNALKFDETLPRIKALKKIIILADAFDVWKEELGEIFEFSKKLNEYFMYRGKLNLIDYFYFSDYKLPDDFLPVVEEIQKTADDYYLKQKEKNLIFSPHSDYSFGFIDLYFNHCVDKVLKSGKKIFITASSFGAMRFRFLKEHQGGFSDELIFKIKTAILDGEITGHLHSFVTDLDVSSTEKIIERFKQVDGIIREVLEKE